MTITKTRGSIRFSRRTNAARLLPMPSRYRARLLSGTAIVGGALIAVGTLIVMPRPTLAETITAACGKTGNNYTCNTTTNDPIVLEPGGPFSVNMGGDLNLPLIWNGSNALPAVTIHAGGFSTSTTPPFTYGIHLNPGSSITNGSGEGLYVTDVGTVVINIDAATTTPEAHTAASIAGTQGIHVDGQGFSEGGEGDGSIGTSVTINVNGHVSGSSGAGVEVTNVSTVTVNSKTFKSILGSGNLAGIYAHDDDQVFVYNEDGLTAGVLSTTDGIWITEISGLDKGSGNAVYIANTSGPLKHGAVIVGGSDGVRVSGLFGVSSEGDANDLAIDNFAIPTLAGDAITWAPGGLIAGMGSDGIYAADINGNTTIDNRFTREGSIDFSTLDSAVWGSEGDLLGPTGSSVPGTTGFSTGIYGRLDGIIGTGIDKKVTIRNRDGRIAGATADGILLTDIGGSDVAIRGVEVDNSGGNILDLGRFAFGGTIWGARDGVTISNVDGVFVTALGLSPVTPSFTYGVGVYNDDGGSIFGGESGVSVTQSLSNVLVSNYGGIIEGFTEEGVHLSTAYDHGVVVLNGYGRFSQTSASEGRIIADDTALNLTSGTAFVWNAMGGSVIGSGADVAPVITLSTDPAVSFASGISGNIVDENEGGGEPVEYLDELARVGSLIVNGGVLTSTENPHFERGVLNVASQVNQLPNDTVATQAMFDDTALFADYAATGGAFGSLSNGSTDLNDYAATAEDLLIQSESGAVTVFNGDILRAFQTESDVGIADGLMFGRVNLTSSTFVDYTDSESPDGTVGNTLVNLGKWFTTNRDGESGSEFGNVMNSDAGEDAIFNFGLVQTAFHGESGDTTTFVLDDFYNGDPLGVITTEAADDTDNTFSGLVSMIDDGADDRTFIYGNFHGAATGSTARSYLGIDVFFADPNEGGVSDTLQIGSEGDLVDVTGTTGVIVHKLNTATDASTKIGDRIVVVYAYTGDQLEDFTCTATWCQDGDSFFVSDHSPDYVQVNGAGFVRDGLFMWGMKQFEVPNDPQTDLVATWGPDAAQQSSLGPSLTRLWNDTAGHAEDNVYGLVYPQTNTATGGAGADLSAIPDTIVAPPEATPQKSALWGRLTGSWTSRDTTISQSAPPSTFNSSLDQSTYGLTAGVEFRPNGGDSQSRFGLYGGYLASNLSFDTFTAASHSSGGTVGGYAALIKGPWYIDAEVKADFLSLDYTSPSVSLSTHGTSIGVLANTGYRMENGKSFFEPIASFSFVNSAIGNTSGGGGSITYSGTQSIRGGLGARVGVTLGAAGGTQTELDVLGKVWDEFGPASTVTVSDGVNTTTFTDSFSGISGEVVGRATIYNADRSSSGFASVGGKFGTGTTSVSAKVGVRKNF
ncbi:MAG: autotransporter outer membrane beta-barrel domain-containing protein [Bauldia sp.]